MLYEVITTMQDPNGLELIRAWAVLSYLISQVRYEYFRSYDVIQPPKIEINLFSLPRDFTLNHTVMMHSIIRWLIRIYPPKNGLDFLLDAFVITSYSIHYTKLYDILSKENKENEKIEAAPNTDRKKHL